MLFSEVYGSYYNVIASILTEAVAGRLSDKRLMEIIREKAFAESVLTVPQNLKNETWPLLTKDLKTAIVNPPTMPLTTLQKRWLKAILQDKRVQLFSPSTSGLEEVEPLYPADAFVYFDRYADGDPFEDKKYAKHFRTALKAIKEKRKLWIEYEGSHGNTFKTVCKPVKLEYSSKDDKFRLFACKDGKTLTINIARIKQCEAKGIFFENECIMKPPYKRTLVLELVDERNALERAMLHFSHLEKETERIGDNRYRVTLHYEGDDETEILIRVLSFGPVIRVVSPESFKDKLMERIERQLQFTH